MKRMFVWFFFLTAVFLIILFAYSFASSTSCTPATGEELVSHARAFLCQKYNLDESQSELRTMSRLTDLVLGEPGTEFRFSRWGQYWVSMEGFSRGKKVRTLHIKFKLLKFVEVFHAGRDIKAKELVRSEDFTRERIAIDPAAADTLVNNSDFFTGKRAKYLLREGTVVGKNKLEPVPFINKYEDAVIMVTGDGMTLSSTAKALEDGFIGSAIKIRLNNGKIMNGVINEGGSVEIKFREGEE